MKRMKLFASPLPLFFSFFCLILGGCAKDNTPLPTPLSALPSSPIQFQTVWSHSPTNGNDGEDLILGSALQGDTIVTAGLNGRVVALNAGTGDIIWKTSVSGHVSAIPGLNDSEVFISTRESQLIALDLNSGTVKWTAALPSVSLAAPAANTDIVVVQTHDSTVSAYSAEAGGFLWSYTATSPSLSLYRSSSPVLYNNHAFVGFANGQLGAFDLAHGAESWQVAIAIPASPDSATQNLVDLSGTPALDQGLLFATSYHGNLAAINPLNGQIIWQKPLSSFEAPCINQGLIFVTDETSAVLAIDERSSQTLWKQSSLLYRFVTAPIAFNNMIVVGDYAGYLHFLSKTDGHEITRFSVGGNGIKSPPLVYQNTLIVTSNNGNITALQPNG